MVEAIIAREDGGVGFSEELLRNPLLLERSTSRVFLAFGTFDLDLVVLMVAGLLVLIPLPVV